MSPSATDSRTQERGLAAMANLGELLQEQGDIAGAKAAYQQLIDSGDPDKAPVGARRLSELPD